MKLHEKMNIAVLPAAIALLLSGLMRLGLTVTGLYYYLPYTFQSGVITLVSLIPAILFYRRSSLFWGRPALKITAPITSSIPILFGCGTCLTMHLLLGAFSPDPQHGTPVSLTGLTPWLLRVLTMAVLPAVLEEWLFRGCILSFLSIHDMRAAVLFSSVLFALIHHGWQSMLFAFAAGIVLGCVRLSCGSVWGCVIVHLVNNTAVLCVQALNDMLPNKAVFLPYCIISFFCLMSAVATAHPLYRKLSRICRNKPYSLSAFVREVCRCGVFFAYVLTVLLLHII